MEPGIQVYRDEASAVKYICPGTHAFSCRYIVGLGLFCCVIHSWAIKAIITIFTFNIEFLIADIDECAADDTIDCGGTCLNTQGSYFCLAGRLHG